MNSMEEKLAVFQELLEIMNRLRAECPWDKKQTNESLRNLTIEETYELADAILEENPDEIMKELGDMLLHIVFYAKIGSETGDFDMADIIKNLNKKLIYRHPHIFSDTKVNDAEDVKRNWEELKIREGKKVLEGVPGSLPAMIKANRIQEKVRAVGFDWDEKSQIWDKVREELEELETEVRNEDQEKTELEFGDLLFSVINAARLYGVDPETALEKTNLKFIKRFGYLEKNTLRKGRSLKDMNLDEMNEIWEQAKDYD
ncbi:MAG: nucleoside triphosphate pyrophosphohydrolase, partial [Bacteroidales bacterium]|nr:nucleoside triphosphate pyrophosphohydrolase [Bacteroidales bacterium]